MYVCVVGYKNITFDIWWTEWFEWEKVGTIEQCWAYWRFLNRRYKWRFCFAYDTIEKKWDAGSPDFPLFESRICWHPPPPSSALAAVCITSSMDGRRRCMGENKWGNIINRRGGEALISPEWNLFVGPDVSISHRTIPHPTSSPALSLSFHTPSQKVTFRHSFFNGKCLPRTSNGRRAKISC